MSFDVHVVFSGLCAFIPNQGNEDSKGLPTRVQVLLVDARKPRLAVDNVMLTPHFPRLYFNADLLVPAPQLPTGTELVVPLERKEVRFMIPYTAEGANPFSLVEGELDNDRMPEDLKDFRWGLDMKELWPDFSEVDPAALEDSGSKGLTVARVVVDRGKLSSYQFEGGPYWTFRSSDKRAFASRAAVDFSELDYFMLVVRDLDCGTVEVFPLTSRNGEPVRIHVANLCNACRPKIIEPGPPAALPKQDDDFRWYYEICANRGLLATDYAPGKQELPVPVLASDSEESDGRGDVAAKCMRLTFAGSTKA